MMVRIRANGLHVVALMLLVLVSVIACAPGDGRGAPKGLAQVDEVTIQIMESFPVQVNALAKGTLPDGCTRIDQINQNWNVEQKRFTVEITTIREGEACTQALVPFAEVIPLDVYGLPAGTYTVEVNGVTETFTLDVANRLPEESVE